MKRLLAAVLLLAGCQTMDRRVVFDPGHDEVIRVVNGDRFYFDLSEDAGADVLWDFSCDNEDVEVTIDHASDGRTAAVRIRIHRGFDGPAAVCFFRRVNARRHADGQFTLSLFRRTGDVAFWK